MIVDGDRAQDKPLIDFDTLHERNFRNTPGFMFPSQVATMMQCETEDLLQVAGASFLPIFGAAIANRYPSAPLYIIARRSRQCIVTFVRSEATPATISNVLANRSELRPPMAFTVLKAEKDDFTNYNRLVRARTRKKAPLIPEYHPVHWTNIPVDPRTGQGDVIPTWNRGLVTAAINLTNQMLRTMAHPENENDTPFYFPTFYDDDRIALEEAIPVDNMEVISLIMYATDDVTYIHRVDRAAREISTSLARTVAGASTFPSRTSLVNLRHPHMSTTQLCHYQKKLGEQGELEIAKLIYGVHMARHFSEAVTSALLGPEDSEIMYPLLNPILQPADIAARHVADRATGSSMPKMDPNTPVSLDNTAFPVPPPQPDSISQSSSEAPTPASPSQLPISHPSRPPSSGATASEAAPIQEVVEVVEVKIPAEHQDAEMLSVSGSEAAPELEVQEQLESQIEDVLQLEEEPMSVPFTEITIPDAEPEESN